MFRIETKDKNSWARSGRLETPHGTIETPAYVMVGTHAKVRTLETADLVATKTQVIIVNTYHMWFTPLETRGDDAAILNGIRNLSLTGQGGPAQAKNFPGLHSYMNWNGPLMTDSGGFQVFSLGAAREQGVGKVTPAGSHPERERRISGESLVRITEDGVYFKASTDAPEQYLDAEKSMEIQARLGADIIFAFDEATSPYHDHAYTEKSMERTRRWAKRSLDAHSPEQLLYGIVQGGPFEDLRKESARIIGKMPFDGFGIGGSYGASFGDTQKGTYAALDWTIPLLPEDKPRHFLGIGKIEDIFEGVEHGIDTFDCVIPTREARHGSIWTRAGRYDIKRADTKDDTRPMEEGCACLACVAVSRKSLREMFKAKDREAGRFATIHNVHFFNALMSEIREGIKNEKFDAVKMRYLCRK